MIVDHLLELSDSQSLSAAAATTNTVDYGQEAPTTGMAGLDLVMVFTVAEDIKGSVSFAIQHSDQETTGFVNAVVSETLTAPAAGTRVVLKMPYVHKRFVRGYYGASPTAGKVDAIITTGFDQNVPFKQAASVQALY